MKNQTMLVAKNVYRNRIKGMGFWAMVLSPFLVAAIYLIIGLVVGSSISAKPNLAVVGSPQLTTVLKANKSVNANLSDITDNATAVSQLNAGKIDGFLENNNGAYTLTTSDKTAIKFTEATYQQALTQINMLQTAQKLGLSGDSLKQLLTPAPLTMKVQTAGKTTSGGDRKTSANMVVSIVLAIFVMMLLMMYVTIIAQEIANEKSSRIMETLLAATSARVQYYGKILGVIGLAFTQIVLYALGFGITAFFLKDNKTIKGITSILSGMDVSFAVYAVLMTVVGILGYLFVGSIVASLINEQAQVQQATQPLAFLALVGYLLSIAGSTNPMNIGLRVASFIPFVSPTYMTSRLAVQFSSTWEAWIAFALQVAATVAVAKLGESIYARNVLSYSDVKILRQFFRNLRGGNSGAGTLALEAPSCSAPVDGQAQKSWRQRMSIRTRIILIVLIIALFILIRFVFLKK